MWFRPLGLVVLLIAVRGLTSRAAEEPAFEPPRIIVGPAVLDIEIPAPAGKEGQGGSGKAVPIEKLPEILAEHGKELRQKIEAARKAVDAEAAAGKITEPMAQSLRWSLRLAGESGKEVREMLASIRVSQQSETIVAAVKDIERAATMHVKRRETILRDAIRTVGQEVSGAVSGTPASAEVGKLIESLEAGEKAMEKSEIDFNEPVIPWRLAGNILRALKDMITGEESGSHQDLGTAAQMFRNACQGSRELVSEEKVKTRIERMLVPLTKLVKASQDALDSALVASRPPQEIARLFQEYATALEGADVVRANSGANQESRSAITFYRKLLACIGSLEAGEALRENQERLREIRQALEQLGPARSARFTDLLQKWEKTLEQRTAAARTKREDSIRDRLASAKEPADLDAIVAELAASAQAGVQRGEPDASMTAGLAETLNALSSAWLSLNPTFLQADAQRSSGSSRFAAGTPIANPLAKEINALRKRIERDILVKGLNVPELAAPPLSDLPADAAIEAFCDNLAKQGEWKRLMTFLQARAAVSPVAAQHHDEALQAIRAYFIGRNFETAEQWADAIQSFKTVLRSTSGRAPIKEASERLKTLTKEHPDVTPPQPVVPPAGATPPVR